MPGFEIINEKERKAINKLFLYGPVLSSTGASPLRKNFHVREFEKEICKKFKSKYALAITSGTAAIKIALDAKKDGKALSIGLLGNCADVLPEFLKRNIIPDIVTDQTSAHDELNGYVPHGITFNEAIKLRAYNNK